MLKYVQWTMQCLFAICLMWHPSLQADQIPHNIKIAAEDNWAPFADHNGKGLSHDLIYQAFSRMNINVDTIVVSYARGLVMADSGLVDGVFNLHKEQSTVNRFIFGSEPLFSTTASFYQNNAHPITAQTKWDIPKNSKIGIIEGYEYGDELINLTHLNIVKVNNHNQLINLLLLNRLDAIIMYDQVAKQYINEMGVSNVISKSVPNHKGELYLAFSKHSPSAQLFADKLDQGLKSLKQDGSYNKIMGSIQTSIE
ncbi:substrate-binding periplasmic protein [Shewanella psychrotolerans]|uniref:substrate-binding periplasmic protein n=1 Tax=Shewanella psychrotolerans TaxID=2864206 RepID=UPI001C65F54F|nr:transporter substrate-binding domain-containing protein [Shewanella psychrotolerans]QYK00457.1 transporter substrate-binding domain-containing protein [Shewanella psychrotolerans]